MTFIPVSGLFASLFRRMFSRQLTFFHARHERFFIAERLVWSDEGARETRWRSEEKRNEIGTMCVGPRAVRGPPGAIFPRGVQRTWKRFNVIRIRIGLKRLLPRAREHGQGSLFVRSYRWRFFPRAQTWISAFCARTRSMRSYLLIMPGSYHHRYRLALHRRKNARTRSLIRVINGKCAMVRRMHCTRLIVD